MPGGETTRYTAFRGNRRLTSGPLAEVVLAVKAVADRGDEESVLVFDDATGRLVDLDLRSTANELVERLAPAGTPDACDASGADPSAGEHSPHRGPGRPRLGVVGREVTLLPRHWQWLSEQPGGASVTLRKLVEQARKANGKQDVVRKARETAYRFLSHMAGDLPGFEEATRALFAGQAASFDKQTAGWPADLRDHARLLAGPAFATPTSAPPVSTP